MFLPKLVIRPFLKCYGSLGLFLFLILLTSSTSYADYPDCRTFGCPAGTSCVNISATIASSGNNVRVNESYGNYACMAGSCQVPDLGNQMSDYVSNGYAVDYRMGASSIASSACGTSIGCQNGFACVRYVGVSSYNGAGRCFQVHDVHENFEGQTPENCCANTNNILNPGEACCAWDDNLVNQPDGTSMCVNCAGGVNPSPVGATCGTQGPGATETCCGPNSGPDRRYCSTVDNKCKVAGSPQMCNSGGSPVGIAIGQICHAAGAPEPDFNFCPSCVNSGVTTTDAQGNKRCAGLATGEACTEDCQCNANGTQPGFCGTGGQCNTNVNNTPECQTIGQGCFPTSSNPDHICCAVGTTSTGQSVQLTCDTTQIQPPFSGTCRATTTPPPACRTLGQGCTTSGQTQCCPTGSVNNGQPVPMFCDTNNPSNAPGGPAGGWDGTCTADPTAPACSSTSGSSCANAAGCCISAGLSCINGSCVNVGGPGGPGGNPTFCGGNACGGPGQACGLGYRCNSGFCSYDTSCLQYPAGATYTGPIVQIDDLLVSIFHILYPGAILLGAASTLYSGYMIATSEGEPNKYKEAMAQFIASLAGILFIMLSGVLIRFIINTVIGADIVY